MKTLIDKQLTELYAERERVIARMRALANKQEEHFVQISVADLRAMLTALDVSDWSRD